MIVFGFGSQKNICDFYNQNICSVASPATQKTALAKK